MTFKYMPFKLSSQKRNALSRTSEREFDREVKKIDLLQGSTAKIQESAKKCIKSHTVIAAKAFKEISLQDKITLIKASEGTPKPTHAALSSRFGIGRSTVGGILKKKRLYEAAWESSVCSKRHRLSKTTVAEQVNEKVYWFFNHAISMNIPINGPVLQQKALEFAEDINLKNFKASNGWLDKWKKRYNITKFKITDICGEISLKNYGSADDQIHAESMEIIENISSIGEKEIKKEGGEEEDEEGREDRETSPPTTSEANHYINELTQYFVNRDEYGEVGKHLSALMETLRNILIQEGKVPC